MQYQNVILGKFIDRPNRFIAHVEIKGQVETVHVKNTGRCRELLLPGAEVALAISDNPKRKTRYDLISVQKPSLGWVNIDSMAPNQVAKEWLQDQGYTAIRPEYSWGSSRIDFSMEKDGKPYLMEVKGCTLEKDGIGYFPDAPTERGIKHIKELCKAKEEGYSTILAFVIPMEGVTEVRPNMETHPQFGEALEEARGLGLELLFIACQVTKDSVTWTGFQFA